MTCATTMAGSGTNQSIRKGHKRFYELLAVMEDLHDRKNSNYSSDKDPLSNFRECEAFGVPAHVGTMVRMSDKWSRLVQLMSGKKDAVGESMMDTLMDLSVYCLLEIILLEEEQARQQSNTQS